MVRISSGGSSMRSGATVRKYGGRTNISAGAGRSKPTRAGPRSQIRRVEQIRTVRTNPRGKGLIIGIARKQTLKRGPTGGLSKKHENKSKEVYVKPKGKYVTSNPAPYGRDKDGDAKPKPKGTWNKGFIATSGTKATRKKQGSKYAVTKVARRAKQSVGAVKGSGIKTIKFKSIKAGKPKNNMKALLAAASSKQRSKGLTTLSKTRRYKPKTVTKMGPHGTVKSRTTKLTRKPPAISRKFKKQAY